MFNLRGSKKPDPVDALLRQTLGGQSVLYRLFREALGCDDAGIRRLELTYFAATVMTVAYLRLGKPPGHLDDYTKRLLERCIPSSGEQIGLRVAAQQYQQRYAEYSALLTPVFQNFADVQTDDKAGHPAITLLLHVFECVTGTSAQGRMLDIAQTAPLIVEFVADHIDFVETKP
ncbi:MAG: hypothetical protein RLN99_00290 [Kiloniellaceae bacterium]